MQNIWAEIRATKIVQKIRATGSAKIRAESAAGFCKPLELNSFSLRSTQLEIFSYLGTAFGKTTWGGLRAAFKADLRTNPHRARLVHPTLSVHRESRSA